ncbi:MAG: hypothetical protein WCK34_08745 [Bacteroidota bacterium]
MKRPIFLLIAFMIAKIIFSQDAKQVIEDLTGESMTIKTGNVIGTIDMRAKSVAAGVTCGINYYLGDDLRRGSTTLSFGDWSPWVTIEYNNWGNMSVKVGYKATGDCYPSVQVRYWKSSNTINSSNSLGNKELIDILNKAQYDFNTRKAEQIKEERRQQWDDLIRKTQIQEERKQQWDDLLRKTEHVQEDKKQQFINQSNLGGNNNGNKKYCGQCPKCGRKFYSDHEFNSITNCSCHYSGTINLCK